MPEDDPFSKYQVGTAVKSPTAQPAAKPKESPAKAPVASKEAPKQTKPTTVPTKEDPFGKYAVDEGIKKTEVTPEREELSRRIFRTLYQIPSGIATAVTYPLDLAQAGSRLAELALEKAGQGDIVKTIKENELIPEYLRTQGGLETKLEELGAPVLPKTKEQQALKLGTTAATFMPGGAGSKASAFTLAPTTKFLAEKAGVPEPLSDLIGLGSTGLIPLMRRGVANLFPKTQEKALAESLASAPPSPPGGGPPSRLRPYEEAARALSTPEVPAEVPPPPRLQAQLPETRGQGTLQGRQAQVLPEGVPFRPQGEITEPADRIGNIVSPQRFRNTTQGGQAVTNDIRLKDEGAYRQVNQLYDNSRELNRGFQEIHPQLVQRLQNRIAEIDAIAHPSGPQQQLRTTMQAQLNRLAQFDAEGNIIGYTPVSNQALIDQIQASRHAVDYDFGHGKPKNIFRPFIQDLQDAAIAAAERNNPEAATALREAQTAYRDWVTVFDNDYIRPFRDLSNRDFSKNFKTLMQSDNYNVVREILETTPGGQEFSRGIRREIVEDKLAPFLKDPKKANIRDFDKTIRELEAISPAEELSGIRREFMQSRKGPPFIRARVQEKPALRAAEKAMNMTLEDIQKEMNSVSGIMRIRDKLPKTIYEPVAQSKVHSILHENQISKKFTGNDLKRVLNKEAENNLLSTLIGEEAVEDARLVAEKLGDRQMTIDNVKSLGKHVSALNFLKYVIPLIP